MSLDFQLIYYVNWGLIEAGFYILNKFFTKPSISLHCIGGNVRCGDDIGHFSKLCDFFRGSITKSFIGKIAQISLHALKEAYPDLSSVDFLNASGQASEFSAAAQALDAQTNQGSLSELKKYDFIFCHARSPQPILTADLKAAIKKSAIITTFATETYLELADEYFNTESANVIIDWDKTLSSAKDLKRAVEKGTTITEKTIRLQELFQQKSSLNPEAAYTVFRSGGTPMQNLAVLKLLTKEK